MTWLSVETLASGTSVSSQNEIVLGSSFGDGAGEMAGERRSVRMPDARLSGDSNDRRTVVILLGH